MIVRSVGRTWHWCSRKTRRPAGHPYDETNTYVSRAGKRHCRACNRIGHRRRYWQQKVSVAA